MSGKIVGISLFVISTIWFLGGCATFPTEFPPIDSSTMAAWDQAPARATPSEPLVRVALLRSSQAKSVELGMTAASIANRRFDLAFIQKQGIEVTDVIITPIRDIRICQDHEPANGNKSICKSADDPNVAFVFRSFTKGEINKASISIGGGVTYGPFGNRRDGVIAQILPAAPTL